MTRNDEKRVEWASNTSVWEKNISFTLCFIPWYDWKTATVKGWATEKVEYANQTGDGYSSDWKVIESFDIYHSMRDVDC